MALLIFSRKSDPIPCPLPTFNHVPIPDITPFLKALLNILILLIAYPIIVFYLELIVMFCVKRLYVGMIGVMLT